MVPTLLLSRSSTRKWIRSSFIHRPITIHAIRRCIRQTSSELRAIYGICTVFYQQTRTATRKGGPKTSCFFSNCTCPHKVSRRTSHSFDKWKGRLLLTPSPTYWDVFVCYGKPVVTWMTLRRPVSPLTIQHLSMLGFGFGFEVPGSIHSVIHVARSTYGIKTLTVEKNCSHNQFNLNRFYPTRTVRAGRRHLTPGMKLNHSVLFWGSSIINNRIRS